MGMFDDLIPQQTAPPKITFDDLIPAKPKPDPRFPVSADDTTALDRARKNNRIGRKPEPGMPGAKTITGVGSGMRDPKREAEMKALDAAKPKGMFDDLIPAKKPVAADKSSLMGDLTASWYQLQQALAGNTLVSSETGLANAATQPRSGRGAGFTGTPVSRRLDAERRQTGAIQDISDYGKKIAAIPEAPAATAFNNSKTFGEAWGNFWVDPLTVTRSTVGRSAAISIPSVVGGIVGSVVGPMGAAAGAGAGSYTAELGSAIAEQLQKHGADINDPKSIQAVWATHKDAITKAAHERAMIVGGVDALTGGVGSKIAALPGVGIIKKEVAGTLAEGAGGAIGEAGAQYNEDGTIRPGAVAGEFLGELGSGAVQTGGQIAVEGMRGDRQPPAVPTAAPPAAGPAPRVEPNMFADLIPKKPAVELPPTPPGYTGPTENTGIAPEDVQSMTPGQRAVIEKDLAEQGAPPPPPVTQPIGNVSRETKPEPGKAPLAPRNFAPPKENMFADLVPAKPEIVEPSARGPIQPISSPGDIETIEKKPSEAPSATISEKPADLSTKPAQPVEQIAEMPQPQPKPVPVPRAPIMRRDMEDDSAVTSSGRDVPVKYAVVEASDLVASQLDDGGSNPQYPAELQPRDRERAVSQQQVQDIATRLDPRLLDKSPKVSDGAPIIAADGTVESGNGRVLAIRRAYKQGGEAAKRYRDHLTAQGYPVSDVREPVLVRVRQGEMDPESRQAFTREANERDTLGMSATERAMADATALPDNVLEMYRGGDVQAAGNREFVRAFIRDVVAKNDQANIISADGAVSQDAIRRIEAALLGKAYGDADLVASLVESPDTNIKAIGGALMDVAPAWAQMRSEAKAGTIDKDADQTERLLEAVRLVQRARREDQPLSLLVGQNDIFSGTSLHPIAEAFLRLMFRDMKNWKQPMGRDRLASALQFYVDEERKTSSGVDLLGETAAKPNDILSLAKRKQDNGEAAATADQPTLDLAKRPSPRTGESAGASGVERAAQDIPAGQASRSEETSPDGGFDADAWNKAREDRIKASKAAGNKHLDQVPAYVESMRGKEIYNVHDTKERGTVRTVSNRGDVVIHWADAYSAEKNLAEKKTEGKGRKTKEVSESWLAPTDLKDYVFASRSEKADGDGKPEPKIEPPKAAEPKPQPARPPEPLKGTEPTARLPENKITDFGEKIEGARKDAVRDIVQSLNDDLDIAAEPLSKSFPQPDYEKLAEAGVDRKALALVAVMRDVIPMKPKKAYKLKSWVDSVKQLRDFSSDLLEGILTAEAISKKMRESRLSKLANTAEIISDIAPEHLPFAAKFRVTSHNYMKLNGKEYPGGQTRYALEDERGRLTRIDEKTLDALKAPATEAIQAAIDKQVAQGPVEKRTPIKFYRDRKSNELFIGFKGMRDVIRLKSGFADMKEARSYVEEHADELQAKIDEMRKGPDERRAANAPRVGPARRDGDVSPQQFNEVFGFRGVQFGNWVEGDRRQSDLNEAFDALMDMADILAIPPRALSLDGQLGLAFGARGHGKAMAHYEASQIVINLTKTKGAGSLAHEWLHAMDNYFAKQDSGTTTPVRAYISERKDAGGKTRKAVFDAWKAVEKVITAGSFADRSREFDAARAKPYFGTTIEKAARAFERYVHDRMAEQGASNDYLANINLNAGAYPTEAEMQEQGIRQAYDDLFKAVETQKGEGGSVALREDGDEVSPSFTYIPLNSFIPSDKNNLGARAKEYVLRHGKRLGAEVLLAFDGDGNVVSDGHGTLGEVGYSELYTRMMYDPGAKMAVHHNHPKSTSLSWQDLRHLAAEGITVIYAHGTDGNTHGASMPSDLKELDFFEIEQILSAAWAPANRAVMDNFRNEIAAKSVALEEAKLYHNHLVNSALHMAGIIDYTSTIDISIQERFSSIIREAAVAAKNAYDNIAAEGTGINRVPGRANPVRHIAGMGGLSEARRDDSGGRPNQNGPATDGLRDDRRKEEPYNEDEVGYTAPRRRQSGTRGMPASRPGPASFIEPDDSAMSVLMNQNLPMLGRIGGAISNASLPIRRGVQDKMADWKRQEKAMTEQTGVLPQSMRVYRTETLFHGRTGERLEDLRMDTIEPLIQKMADLKVTQADLDKYLYARHAPERNEYIASINPDLPDGGSGMTNAEAQAVIRDMQRRGVLANVKTVAAKIDIMLRDNRERLFNNGIIDQETFDSWSSDYEHYVPLRGFEIDPEEDARLGQGKRYDSRTKVVLEALGRKSKADSPLAYIIAQAQQSIILAEKARVGRSVLRLARQYPNPNLWEVDQVVSKRVLDPTTGLVSTRIDNTARVRAENVLAVREGGKLYWVTLHHAGLLAGIKGTEASSMNAVLRMGTTINRYLALMRTGLDPQFFIPNFLRDLETAGIHIAADQGKTILKNVLRDLPKALAGSFKGERGNLNSAWAQHYREFAQAGGKVGVFGLEDIGTIKNRISRDLSWAEGGTAVSALKAAAAVKDFVMDINGAIESGVRLSLFVNMRRAGYSVDDAAFAAKEATVNFNRKGEWGNWLNATYMFFNASVQGTARIAQALAKSKLVRRAAFGMFITGIIMDIVNSMLAGDSDDDGENDYDQIQEHVKERNLIFMWPGSESGQETHIPLPWVYNVFFYTGNNMGRIIRGKIKPTEGAANIMGAIAQSANPLYSNSWVQMLTPTILDPGLDLYMNEDWKGDKIMPEDSPYGLPTPDSQKAWETVNPAWKKTAETLNSLSGGDTVRPGTIDVSPESIEYIWDFLLGGVGSTINQVSTTATTIIRGDEINPERIPFVRKVYGKHVSATGRDEYYQMRDAVLLTDAQIEEAKDAKDRAKMIAVRKEFPADVRALPLLKETDKLLTKLRKQKNAAASNEAKQKINERMDLIRSRFRKKYRQLQENLQ